MKGHPVALTRLRRECVETVIRGHDAGSSASSNGQPNKPVASSETLNCVRVYAACTFRDVASSASNFWVLVVSPD